jgi:hypothetical protein
MKRYGAIALIAILVLGLAVYFGACSGGGGGGGGGIQHVNYSTADQAAAGAASVSGAMSLTSVVGEAANMAIGAVPEYASSRKAKAADTSAIANIDPRLKNVVDKMVADLKSPTIMKAVAKARSFKTASSLDSTITASVSCGVSGYFTVSGADTSTATYNELTIDVAYYNCIEGTVTDYTVASGSLHVYGKDMLDNTGSTGNITATTLTLATYVSSTLSETDAINGTFGSVYSLGTNSVETYSNSVNASFSVTFANDIRFSLGMNNLSGIEVRTPGTTYDTDDDTMNGSIVFDISDATSSLFAVTLAFTGLNDKYQYNTDGSTDEWLNGTISISWTPDMGGNCMPGAITLATIVPIHSAAGACPTSGTITANNATIEFGNPDPPQVTVSVGGDSRVFSDCSFSGADSCGFDQTPSQQPM